MTDEATGGETAEAAPATAEGTEQATTTEAPPSFDTSKLEERMEAQARQMQEQLAQLQERLPAPTEEDELLEPGDDGYEDQEATKALDAWFEERFKERMEPLQQQQMVERRNDEYDALLEDYPEMQDEQFAKPIIARATELARSLNPDAVNRPEFVDLIEAVYKAHVADQRAAREKPAGERKEVVLEGAGGAAPSEPEEDLAARIVAAGNSSSELV